MRRLVFAIFCILLLLSVLALKVDVKIVNASGTIYIRADGNIDPLSAPISTSDKVTYVFTGNIYDSIVIQRSNIIVDGRGFALQGDGSGWGFCVISISNVTITNTNVKGFERGVYLQYASNNTITKNNITENAWWGIWLDGSLNNIVLRNNISNNSIYGIEVGGGNNFVAWNNITGNKHQGLRLVSGGNVLRNNIMTGNQYNFGVWGASLYDLVNDVDTSNLVGHKPICYWVNKSNDSIPSNAGCVVLVNCTNVVVRNLTLMNCGDAIVLAYTNSSLITQNRMTKNFYSVSLESSLNISIVENDFMDNLFNAAFEKSFGTISQNSFEYNEVSLMVGSGNYSIFRNSVVGSKGVGVWLLYGSIASIFENNITSNTYGIMLDVGASNNIFYHNNFIGNTYQVYINPPGDINFWDNGFLTDGNYWSDYNPPDIYSGPYQNETGKDKIGDIPYMMDSNNTDRYPLIYQYGFVPSSDINKDRNVDIFDIVILATAFGTAPGESSWNPFADLNLDEIVDIFDIVIIAADFGKTYP